MKHLRYLFLFLLVAGCASSVTSQFDPNADFSSYETYFICTSSFQVEDPYQPELDNFANREKIAEAIRKQMKRRNVREADEISSDLQVVFHMLFNDKQNSVTRCYDEQSAQYWPGCTTTTYSYTEGSLQVSVIDQKKNQVVWEGKASGILNLDLENTGRAIDAIVSKIFEKYPVTK